MQELIGPIIGITLVLISVFLPAAFMSGITGQMYRQFALVIAATAVLSGINAITLKPTQSAQYLRAPDPDRRPNRFTQWFNGALTRIEAGYLRMIGGLLRHRTKSTLAAFALIAAAGYGFMRIPTDFLPVEDQGYVMVAVQLPDAASLERTQRTLRADRRCRPRGTGRRPRDQFRRRLAVWTGTPCCRAMRLCRMAGSST